MCLRRGIDLRGASSHPQLLTTVLAGRVAAQVAMLGSSPNSQHQVFLLLLRRTRQGKRLRQADLAMRIGQGQSMVSKIERGVRRLDIVELRAWLKALEVDFLSFMAELDQSLGSAPTSDFLLPSRRCAPTRRRMPAHHRSSRG